MLLPAFVFSSPLEVVGLIKEAHLPKEETQVFVNYFNKDTIIYTDSRGIYDVTLNVPFKSGYITISTVDCIGDTIKNIEFYASNQQLIVSNFELCKRNFRTFLVGNVFYHKNPARGALIELSLNNFQTILEILYTDTNGHYEAFMGTGPNKSGVMSARVKDCTGRYIYNQVEFKDGDTLNLDFVKCRAPGETLVTGQVKQGTHNTRKNEVKLLLYVLDRETKDIVLADSTVTKSGGGYHFFLQDVDAYTIKALPVSNYSMFFPTYVNGAIFWDEDPVIIFKQLISQIRKDIIMDQNFQAINEKSIEGKIVIENDKGLSRNQPPVLLLTLEKKPIDYTYADENGNYIFERIPSGEYFVWVDDPGKLTIPIKVKLEENVQSLVVEDIVVTDFAIGSRTTSQKEKTLTQNAINLYPNPFVDYLRFNVKEETILEVEILSISGELVKRTKISSYETIGTSDMPNGTYLIKIKTENKTIVQRMIKI